MELAGDYVVSKKNLAERSKKKIKNEIKKHKNALKERSPLEKAKRAYYTEVEGTLPTEETKDIEKSESYQEPMVKETKSKVYTNNLSKKIDESYEKLQRTSRGLAAATSVFLGETLGIDTSADSEDLESQVEDVKKDHSTAVALARKILKRKKEERRDSTE